MHWHILRFDLSGREVAEQQRIIEVLERLKTIPLVRRAVVGRDVDNSDVVGVVIRFDKSSDVAEYRAHATHAEVRSFLVANGLRATHLDVVE